ncbi:unnamed protein product [Haemonchus placei]|uniref:Ovule protein n=1 Tax=Haemonchus placei TaxID=6290 RepID=A0A0N4X7D6_HAEPC|nr:unnamed protein product [Haemonchus placei]
MHSSSYQNSRPTESFCFCFENSLGCAIRLYFNSMSSDMPVIVVPSVVLGYFTRNSLRSLDRIT